MDVSLFDFNLPEAAIALRPVSPRDSAKLLQVAQGGELSDHKFSDLASLLNDGDVLVLNETKVFAAALKGVRAARAQGGGGDITVDVNLHTPVSDTVWRAFIRPAKRVRSGDILTFSDTLSATVIDKQNGGDVGLEFENKGDLIAAINEAGKPPLPPYIARKRTPDAQDVEDYQTVYASETGGTQRGSACKAHLTCWRWHVFACEV